MEETITVGELITYLSEYGLDKKVVLSAVGFNSNASYDIPLDSGHFTVDEYKGIVRINFYNM
jgi:hypothetical protein